MKIFQAFIGDEQREYVSALAEPYPIPSRTAPGEREFELFCAIDRDWPVDGEPWGLVSWKFEHKSVVPLAEFAEFANRQLDAGKQVVFINPMLANEAIFRSVWEQGLYGGHETIGVVYEYLCDRRPNEFGRDMSVDTMTFCNYLVATPAFWSGYLDFARGVLTHLANRNPERSAVGRAFHGSAGYRRDAEATLRPFVAERLLSTYLSFQDPGVIAHFPHQLEHYEAKFGVRLGRLLHELSGQKQEAVWSGSQQGLLAWHQRRFTLLDSSLRGIVGELDDPPSVLLSRELSMDSLPTR